MSGPSRGSGNQLAGPPIGSVCSSMCGLATGPMALPTGGKASLLGRQHGALQDSEHRLPK